MQYSYLVNSITFLKTKAILNFLMRKALNSTTFSCVQVFIFPALNKLPKKFIRGESVRFFIFGKGGMALMPAAKKYFRGGCSFSFTKF